MQVFILFLLLTCKLGSTLFVEEHRVDWLFSKYKHKPQITNRSKSHNRNIQVSARQTAFSYCATTGPSFSTIGTFLMAFLSWKHLFHEYNYNNDPTLDVILLAPRIAYLQNRSDFATRMTASKRNNRNFVISLDHSSPIQFYAPWLQTTVWQQFPKVQ
jgi:hypothetical protein